MALVPEALAAVARFAGPFCYINAGITCFVYGIQSSIQERQTFGR